MQNLALLLAGQSTTFETLYEINTYNVAQLALTVCYQSAFCFCYR